MVVHVDTIEQLARKLCTVTFFHEFICPCTGIGLCVILTKQRWMVSFHGDTINKIGAGLEKMFASAMTLNVLKMYMCKVVGLLQGALRDFSSRVSQVTLIRSRFLWLLPRFNVLMLQHKNIKAGTGKSQRSLRLKSLRQPIVIFIIHGGCTMKLFDSFP